MTKLWAWLTAITAAMAFSGTAGADDRFTARFDAELSLVEAELCFDGTPPRRLYRHSTAVRHASALSHNGRVISTSGAERVDLPPLPDNACLEWRFDLGAAADAGNSRSVLRIDDSILALTNLWFWKGPWQRPLIARVEIPEGFNFSSPWPPDAENPGWYRPVPTPAGWYTRSAIGRISMSDIELPGGTIELAVLGDLSDKTVEKLTTWIRTNVEAVVPVLGFFPREHVQVVVVPLGPGNEPVPWAHVVRGGGSSVQFYVDETRPLDEFNADWTAAHEFSHLLLPYVSRSDRWLSEGLASYYQNVLRARDGRLSEREAWQKLLDGFGRGQRDTQRESLREATAGGWENVMRIYWSGAAMMLEADMRLRELSNGRQSLDTALGQLNGCCLTGGKLWTARALLDKLDELSGTTVFSAVYDENVESLTFPDVEESLDALGVIERNGQVRLLGQAPLIDIREAIMRGASDDTSSPAIGDNAP